MLARKWTLAAVPAVCLLTLLSSCSNDDDNNIAPNLRTKIAYTQLSDTTSYARLFVDQTGASTVDLSQGRARLSMIRAMDTYMKTVTPAGSTVVLDGTVLKNMFANTGSPFSDAALNTSGLAVRSVTGLSATDPEKVRKRLDDHFVAIAEASKSVQLTAAEGKAGKLGTYLVDAKGIELGQVIAKSFIGAFQLDYIAQTLFSDQSLNADNSKVVSGKKYTQLEHNWDEAYGILTLNARYGMNATPTSNGGESFLGSYVWEYNKEGFAKLHPAFLKGRAAIVNNDKTVLKEQALLIRTEFEKAIAAAARGYLDKWKTAGTNDAARAHAFGEGAGFIYSLRFCKVNGADDAFSDGLLNDLVDSDPKGFWGLTNAKVDAASAKIKAKFNL
jgi:hypothetical protein